MEGYGVIAADPKRNDGKGSLEFLVKDPATSSRFKHLADKAGGWIVRQRWFKQAYMSKTEEFFARHGGKAIILARFAPIIRTFAPFTAGFGKMRYARFLTFSITGGIIWVLSFCLAGYFLGQIPVIKQNLKLVFVLIIVVSLLPIVIEFVRHKMAAKATPPPSENS